MSGEREPAPGPAAEALVGELLKRGFADAEVYEKQGRSRSFERALDRESTGAANEAGWAARAGDARRSLFLAATGAPNANAAFAAPFDPSPHPLLLPDATLVSRLATPAIQAPAPPAPPASLATEGEAAALFDGVARRLSAELAGARLVHARLDDGASEWAVVSSRGLAGRGRSRAAWLRFEAGRQELRIELAAAELEGRRFRPDALARRLADRLAALSGSANGESGAPRAFVLAAPLAARLVEAMAPLFVGRAAGEALARYSQGAAKGRGNGALGSLGAFGAIGASAVTIVDDGGLEGGLLAAASDGEAVPTRRVTLVEAGQFRTPLLAWWEAPAATATTGVAGCARRASYRDAPRRAPTHLFLEPGSAAPAELLGALADGAYLIDAEGAVEVDSATFAWRVPVSGFRIRTGVAPAPLGPRRLTGTLASLFGAVRAVGRDLTFVPGDGMFGAPTLLVEGEAGEAPLELVAPALR